MVSRDEVSAYYRWDAQKNPDTALRSGSFVSFYLAEKLFDHLDGFNVGSGERHCDFWVYAFGDDVVDEGFFSWASNFCFFFVLHGSSVLVGAYSLSSL